MIGFGGHFLLRPLFRYVVMSGVRELFTVAALLLVIGIAVIMQQIGLSMALGTFLAGVLLAESEYRHELEIAIDPFKGYCGLYGTSLCRYGSKPEFIGRKPIRNTYRIVVSGRERFGAVCAGSYLRHSS